jgi:hypothetical protein
MPLHTAVTRADHLKPGVQVIAAVDPDERDAYRRIRSAGLDASLLADIPDASAMVPVAALVTGLEPGDEDGEVIVEIRIHAYRPGAPGDVRGYLALVSMPVGAPVITIGPGL